MIPVAEHMQAFRFGIICGFYSSVFLTSSFWYILGGKKRGVIDEAISKKEKAAKVGPDGAQV